MDERNLPKRPCPNDVHVPVVSRHDRASVFTCILHVRRCDSYLNMSVAHDSRHNFLLLIMDYTHLQFLWSRRNEHLQLQVRGLHSNQSCSFSLCPIHYRGRQSSKSYNEVKV
jgi:hypothetical protein